MKRQGDPRSGVKKGRPTKEPKEQAQEKVLPHPKSLTDCCQTIMEYGKEIGLLKGFVFDDKTI